MKYLKGILYYVLGGSMPNDGAGWFSGMALRVPTVVILTILVGGRIGGWGNPSDPIVVGYVLVGIALAFVTEALTMADGYQDLLFKKLYVE